MQDLGERLERPGVRGLLLVVCGAALVVALIFFGVIPQVVDLGRSLTGDVWLVLGLLVLAVGAGVPGFLGRRAIPTKDQLVGAGIVGSYVALAWLTLSNGEFFDHDGDAAAVSEEARRVQGITLGIISVLLLLVVIGVLAEGAIRKSLSNTTSIAPVVIMLWSVVVVYAIGFIAAAALTTSRPLECGPDNPDTRTVVETAMQNCIQPSSWPDYLLLLGLPGVAAAVAKSRKVDDPDSTQDKSADATSEKMTEVQFFVFNAIAMFFVVWSLATVGVLGDIPDVLLGLTGASALTFSLAKRLPPAKESG